MLPLPLVPAIWMASHGCGILLKIMRALARLSFIAITAAETLPCKSEDFMCGYG